MCPQYCTSEINLNSLSLNICPMDVKICLTLAAVKSQIKGFPCISRLSAQI